MLVAAALWETARILVGPAVVVDVARRADLVQTIVASGHVETPYRVEIGSQITGAVEDVLVEEGQAVQKGQPLVTLESGELRASLVLAQGAVAQAEARLRQMRELTVPWARQALSQAQAVVLNAQKTHERISELARTGSATRQALDDAVKALDIARTQERSAELQVFTAGPGGSDAVLVQTQLDQARASLDTATSRLAYATITAPRDGVLISTMSSEGRSLSLARPCWCWPLAARFSSSSMSTSAISARSQSASRPWPSADAYPDDLMQATVVYINPGINITRASVEAKLRVSDPPPYLRQDMTVSVDIETARRASALVVPARAVRDAGSGKPWVMQVRDGRAARQPVGLGLRGATSIEIVSGIVEGDLLVPASSGIVTGRRIRAVIP